MEELLKEINTILKTKNQEIEFLRIRLNLLEAELKELKAEREKQHGNV